MLLEAEQSQLMLVDFQERLMPAMYQGDAAVENARRLACAAALLKVPTFVTEQNAPRLGATVQALHTALPERARLFHKMMFSAVEEGVCELLAPAAPPPVGNARSLPKHLQKPVAASKREQIVLAGCEAHVCVLQTALDLIEEDFSVWVVTDACSSRTERNRDAAFDRLASAGVDLVSTEMVLFEWLRGCEHPQFKAVQALIKN